MPVILITGGSRGIGASTALQCARQGMDVILTYQQDRAGALENVRRITLEGTRALALPLDLRDTDNFPAFRLALEETLLRRWHCSGLDGLVNNAGFGLFNPIATVRQAQFDDLVQVHLKGPFFLTQTLLPLLNDGASIVNVTSATTRVATAGVAPYAACKGGLEVLTRYMAKELGERNIRVNAVSPGPVRTDLGGGLTPEFEASLASKTALGRIGEPADVGKVIAMLLTDIGAWINGQSIEVAGGYVV